MAKIGNETRLILKLAAEKAKVDVTSQDNHATTNSNLPGVVDYTRGFKEGMARYEYLLQLIINDLERK